MPVSRKGGGAEEGDGRISILGVPQQKIPSSFPHGWGTHCPYTVILKAERERERSPEAAEGQVAGRNSESAFVRKLCSQTLQIWHFRGPRMVPPDQSNGELPSQGHRGFFGGRGGDSK